MITGAHFLLYSSDPQADRGFLRDVLGFPSNDLGDGWLLFTLPPAEMAVHPGDGGFAQLHGDVRMTGAVLYLMCDDVEATIEGLRTRGVRCAGVAEEDWGRATSITLPSGGAIGLYQPSHPTGLGRG